MANDNEETVQDVVDSMTEKQKNVMYALIGQALEDAGVTDEDFEGGDNMKHNVFDNDEMYEDDYLTHADQAGILEMANKVGSFQDALEIFADDNGLQHDAIASGFAQENISTLFPELNAGRKPVRRSTTVRHGEGNAQNVSLEGVEMSGAYVLHNHVVVNGESDTFSDLDFYEMCDHQDVSGFALVSGDKWYWMKPLVPINEAVYNEARLGVPIDALLSGGTSIDEATLEVLRNNGYIDYQRGYL